jgi:transposase-like protein
MSILSRPYFHDEAAAFEFLESVVWADGPVCPHCGDRERIKPLKGKAHRIGLKKCYACRKQFTVKIGTVFEHMRIPLFKCIQAVHLMCCSKKGISAHQLHRILEITYKSAWFLAHRIREAMRSDDLSPSGGEGKIVESDETFIGKKEGAAAKGGGMGHMQSVLSLVERGGEVRSIRMDKVTKADIMDAVEQNVKRESRFMTDQASWYRKGGYPVAEHETVNHNAFEWVRGECHTNTLEGYFSIFKRGMKGVYQHCAEKHLHRYLSEFDFWYNNRKIGDAERTENMLAGIKGKRLTYRLPD